jgi:tripartite-type tricarboxylate transporter receptor subunit TctC
MRKRQILELLMLGLLPPVMAVTPAWAQTGYPNKMVRIVVPFPAGALTDSLARLLAAKLQDKWHQTVVVDNRAGAAGNIGTDNVYRSAPDGYTLLFTPQSTLVLSKLLTPHLSFDPEAFEPIAIVTRSTVLMLASAKVPAHNVEELIAYAAAHPGTLNYATTGTGSTSQLTNDLFFSMSKTTGLNVPYQGIAPASNALLGGEVDILFDAMANALPNIRAGKIHALGVASNERNPALPDVPTVGETLPGFASPLWTGLAAPPKTPQAIVDQISADVAEALKTPEFVARIAGTSGLEAVGSTPAEMQRAMKEERERWSRVIDMTGTKGE